MLRRHMVFSRKLYVFLYLLCSRKRKGSGPPEKIWIDWQKRKRYDNLYRFKSGQKLYCLSSAGEAKDLLRLTGAGQRHCL